MIVGIIRNGEYVRVEQERGAPVKDLSRDYYKGVKPSDLGRLDERQLYVASDRLHESVVNEVGTREERANAAEALHACYRERYRRRATIR
ncbi:MAG TPA: hypothetical protein VGY32_11470 [Solirubrobacteraceae bacterium]|jgi:hypothetical protein|nr:hypothetical protein [Solirubrobacteraceae bacterium]